jgi:ATP-dependent Clp protease adaptor protein ClpS
MPGEQQSTSTSVETEVETEVTTDQRTRRLPPYNVVILNDEDHTFQYVIELLIKLFRHPLPKAEELTLRIHTTGRAIVYTTHKELAELKRDQVIAYGPDPRSKSSKGPLRCYVEPAPTD